MPSPIKSQRIERAPITGVIIIGSSDINITGPRIDLAALFIHKAINNPNKRTNGKVIRVNERVNLNAFQKSIAIN